MGTVFLVKKKNPNLLRNCKPKNVKILNGVEIPKNRQIFLLEIKIKSFVIVSIKIKI